MSTNSRTHITLILLTLVATFTLMVNVAGAQNPSGVEQQPATPVCSNCGTVVGIDERTIKGEGTGLGAIGGALAGVIVGNQIGSGSGKDVARVVGGVGGAVAGHEVEKRARGDKVYDVRVKMFDGTTQLVTVDNADQLAIGTDVRVVGNSLMLR